MIKGKYIIKSNGKTVCEKDNLITTNGFLAINKYLAKGSMDWAGSLVVGGISTSPAITDKTLYYETARVPVTLKSYSKFNPKYVITNKALTSNVATLQFQSIATPTINNGYTIQITGVGTPFDGTFTVNASSYSVITAPTSTTPGTYQISYNKTAGNVTSTAVSSTSSLLTVTYDNASASVYNNEIVLKGTLNPASALYINEIGAIPLSVSSSSLRDTYEISSFSEINPSDASQSLWKISGTNVSLTGTVAIQGSSTSPTGYTWNSGATTATFNVSSTLGLKAGNSVYVTGITPAGAYTAPSGTYTINQINGNYQVILNMGSTAATTQAGYGGTMSLNSTTASQPSFTGLFNVKLTGGSTISLSNLYINSNNYTTSDSIILLYYATAAISAQTITVGFTDSAGSTYSMASSVTIGSAGWNILRLPLTNFTTSTKIISNISVTITGTTDIILDGLKFVTNAYWSAHPLSGVSNVILPTEYQLSSRSIFSSPVIKSPGQQMDIEYHIQVT